MSEWKSGIGTRAVLLLAAIIGALLLSCGMAFAATLINCGSLEQDPLTPACYGTGYADVLEGTAGRDDIYGRGSGDTLKGFGELDHLYGQGGRDTLLGGPDLDVLIGGAGNDELKGGGSGDAYYLDSGWGKDTIADGTGSGNDLHFPSSNRDDVIVRLASGAGPEVKDSAKTSTVNWSDSVIDTVHGGGGDDRITGNALPNNIYVDGTGGTDTVFGGGGDDYIAASDGRVDHVDCGEDLLGGADHDEVVYDSSDDVSANCEIKTLGPPSDF